MFKIAQDPTFPGSIEISSMGRSQKLEVTFRAKTRTEYLDLIKSKDKTGYDVFLELVEKWNADMPLDKASLEKLDDHQPGAVIAVIDAYGDALMAARKGN
jgi:hypothetical protein